MCVHSTHCCKCGCKYGDKYCPVEYGDDPGIKCEYCEEESSELQPILDLLNQAFKNDPNAIYSIMTNRIPCNEKLADDPHIVVNNTTNIKGSRPSYSLNALGLLSGILSCLNLPLVALKWSDEGEPIGFCKDEEE